MGNDRQRLRYLRLSEEDLKIEQKHEFETSVFADVYEKTKNIIRRIIWTPQDTHGFVGKTRSYDTEKGNIITFLGERGSGKSSVLSTILNYLEKEETDFEHACFIPLEMLDASLLEQEEDVFDLILTALVKKYDEMNEAPVMQLMNDSVKTRNFQAKFDSVFEKHQMLRFGKKDELMYEHSSLFALRQLSSSKQIKRELCELVQMFLDLVVRVGKQPYLVVAVDDLDMNIDHAFEIMEQLNRYLTIKNVIVMIAVKYEQMEYVCERHFAKVLPKMNREVEAERAGYIQVTANEYLEKVMPLQNRVYIPAFTDDITHCNANLRIAQEEESIKKTVLGKIARRTNIFMDGCGEGRHFMEPVTLRELNDYYYFLERLSRLYKTQNNGERERHGTQTWRYNYERFIQDIMNRYIYRYLSPNDRNEFKRVVNMSTDVRNRYLHTKYATAAVSPGYGNLLWMFYLKNQKGNDDRFLNCLLLLYSFILNNEWRVFTDDSISEEERKLAGDRMLRIASGSLAGIWMNECTPWLLNTINNAIVKTHIGYISGIRARHPDGIYGISCTAKGITSKNAQSAKYWINWVKSHEKEIHTLEIMAMLLEKITDLSGCQEAIRIRIETEKESDKSDNDQVMITFANYAVDYNALAFVKNSFRYQRFLGDLYEALTAAMLPYYMSAADEYQELLSAIREVSLYSEYETWCANGSCGIAVPFQHTDIYYHMLMRVREAYMEKHEHQVNVGRALETIQNLYDDIEEELKKQDAFYRYKNKELTCFQKYFAECPFIRMIRKPEKLMADFRNHFANVIYSSYSHSADVEEHAKTENNVNTQD